jgi:hypothetical protein
VLETGAEQVGCTTSRRSSSTYAMLDVSCSGDHMTFFQNAEGMVVMCSHMFEGQCDSLSSKVVNAAKKTIATPTPATPEAAVPAAVPAAAPAPAAPQPASQEPAQPESKPGEALPPPR